MGLLTPVKPPYDPIEWTRLSFTDRSRKVCEAWALQGYGTPLGVYLVYLVKVLLYVGGWWLFVRYASGITDPFHPVAFQKAILWSMLFEVLGLGCGSGPLTARYFPPLGGFLYFLRPGTTKLPFIPSLGTRRSWLDVLLYAALLALTLRALLVAQPGRAELLPIAVLLPVLGLLDKTIFLAARGEHYWTTLAVFVMSASWLPGARAVMLALWFWAGVSKLNHHFPAVVCVMTSNSPFTRFAWLRKLMYRRYPDDLSPSPAAVVAHGGILLELGIPILLLVGDGGPVTIVGLAAMVFLHAFITSNVPMGVPIEWNVMMVYGGFALFWKQAGGGLAGMEPHVAVFLAVMLIALPLLGNLFPSRISFLMAMRYYAGNWAYSVWLFRGDSYRKLDRLVKSSAWVPSQLERMYDTATATGIISKVMGFRLMHLHGRALARLVPRAIDRIEDHHWVDGELVAGMALGWNFGDGHLHDERLMRALQEQCGFDEGELRCIFVEAQPLGRRTLHYRVADAQTGVLEEGQLDVRELIGRQPWTQ